MIDQHHGWNVSFKPIWIGFVISLVLVFAAYRIVDHYHLTHRLLIASIISIGCVLTVIQLIFFLHLGLEEKPCWNLWLFILGVILILCVILGTLWIMSNLNYNLMPHMGH